MRPGFGLAGRAVVVTGAASGMGYAVAAALLADGARVAMADRDGAACIAAQAILDPGGASSVAVALDVRDRAGTEALADRCEAQLGRIAGLVAAAGISRPAPAEALTDADWDAVMSVNATGSFISAQVMGRRMLAAERGAIVLVGSLSSAGGQPGRAHYCASKHAVPG